MLLSLLSTVLRYLLLIHTIFTPSYYGYALFLYHCKSHKVILNTTMEFPNCQEVIFQMIITQLAIEIDSCMCTVFTTCVPYVYLMCALCLLLCVLCY